MASATQSTAPLPPATTFPLTGASESYKSHEMKHTHAMTSVKTWAQPPTDPVLYKTLEFKKDPYSDDLRRVGLFHDPYMWPELYVDPALGGATANFSRNKGRQFQTGPPRKGQAYRGLSPFKRLYEGEPAKPALERHRHEPPFLRTRPDPKPSNTGSNEGCFGPAYPHMPDGGSLVGIPTRNGEKYKIYDGGRQPLSHDRANVRTKVGGGLMGGGSEFRYEPDDYERQERERRARVSGYGNGFRPGGSAGGRAWKDTRKQPEVFNPGVTWPDGTSRPKPSVLDNEPVLPFRPSHPPRIGYNCTLSGFPEYLPQASDKLPMRREHEKIWLKADRMHAKPQPPILTKVDHYDNHARG